MHPITAPSPANGSSSWRVSRRSGGRDVPRRNAAAPPRRSATTPRAPTDENRAIAIAAPDCTETMLSTVATTPAITAGRGRTGSAIDLAPWAGQGDAVHAQTL